MRILAWRRLRTCGWTISRFVHTEKRAAHAPMPPRAPMLHTSQSKLRSPAPVRSFNVYTEGIFLRGLCMQTHSSIYVRVK